MREEIALEMPRPGSLPGAGIRQIFRKRSGLGEEVVGHQINGHAQHLLPGKKSVVVQRVLGLAANVEIQRGDLMAEVVEILSDQAGVDVRVDVFLSQEPGRMGGKALEQLR